MLNIPKILLRSLVLVMLAVWGALPAFAAQGTVYSFAVLPSSPPVGLHVKWMPFIERLSCETGLEFRLKLYEKMAEFERDIWNGNPDFIFSSPIQVMVAHTASGYVPLVRARKPVVVGLYVRADSPIIEVGDLIGKKISFVGNKNVCSVAMQHLLSKHSTKLTFDTEYSGSTRNVIINVLLGKSDAGSVFLPELAFESEETRSQLRKIVETPEMAPHPLSAHPRVPAADREAVRKAVLAIAATQDGAVLLNNLRLGDPVPANYQRDYRSLEEIDVKGLTNWGQ